MKNNLSPEHKIDPEACCAGGSKEEENGASSDAQLSPPLIGRGLDTKKYTSESDAAYKTGALRESLDSQGREQSAPPTVRQRRLRTNVVSTRLAIWQKFARSLLSLLRLLLRSACWRQLALRLLPDRMRRLLREIVELDESRRRVLVEGAEVRVEGGHGRVEKTVRGRGRRDEDLPFVQRHLRGAAYALVRTRQVRADVLHRRLEVLGPVAEVGPLVIYVVLELVLFSGRDEILEFLVRRDEHRRLGFS